MCMCVCGRLCERNEPNLTANLARASGAREKALLTTNSLSPCLSHIHTLVEVSNCLNTSFQNMGYWPGQRGK